MRGEEIVSGTGLQHGWIMDPNGRRVGSCVRNVRGDWRRIGRGVVRGEHPLLAGAAASAGRACALVYGRGRRSTGAGIFKIEAAIYIPDEIVSVFEKEELPKVIV